MNIDELTIGELKRITALAQDLTGGATPKTVEPKRVVLVVDKGWIFAGDQSSTADGYIRLTNAVHVFRWERIGFSKVITEWKSDAVDLRAIADVEVPSDSVIFRIPVAAGWGLK